MNDLFAWITGFADAQALLADLRISMAGINHAGWVMLYHAGLYLGEHQVKMFREYLKEEREAA